jgi:hypothetical protein
VHGKRTSQGKRLAVGATFASLFIILGSASAQPQARPTVGLASIDPVSVRGLHFDAAERVVVIVAARSSKWTRRVKAAASGSFVARFGELPVGRCEIAIRAFGSKGSFAHFTPGPPACGGENG